MVCTYKKIVGLWFFGGFEGNFLCQKSTETFRFFSLNKIKKGGQLVLLTHFHNFEFKSTLFFKSEPNFGPSKPKRTKHLELFYTNQVGAEAKFIHP